jgi:hypothetical protein
MQITFRFYPVGVGSERERKSRAVVEPTRPIAHEHVVRAHDIYTNFKAAYRWLQPLS